MTSVSATSSSKTGTLSSAGVGSGLDVQSIVTALVNAESIPLNSLKTAETTLQTKLSTFGTVQSYLSAFRDAAAALSHGSTFAQTVGSSSSPGVVDITTGANTPEGNYTVEVQQLAASQTLATGAYASSDALVGQGSLSIQLGTIGSDGTSFTAGSSSAVNISVSATDTLANVRDKINSSGAGVTASILNDGSGSRLVLKSTNTGAANAFTVTATDSDGNNTDASGLSRISYDPSLPSSQMTKPVSAADAKATINGLPVSSSINSLTEVLDGITLKLGAVTTGAVTLTAKSDTDSIKKAMTTFVDAYNKLNSYLADQTKYDASTKVAGVLQGDSTANSIRSQMRSIMSSSTGASATFSRLSDIGFDIAKDGTLTINDSKLTSSLGNLAEVKKLFTNTDLSTAGNDGIASQLRSLTDGMLNSTGMLTTHTQGIQSSITRNEDRQAQMQTRIDQYEARVRAQYTALDSTMSTLNNLSSYLTQQLTAMSNSNKSS